MDRGEGGGGRAIDITVVGRRGDLGNYRGIIVTRDELRAMAETADIIQTTGVEWVGGDGGGVWIIARVHKDDW